MPAAPERPVDTFAKVKALITRMMDVEAGRRFIEQTLNGLGFKLMNIATMENFPSCRDPERRAQARTGIILDTETMGFDPRTDEIIELGMVRILYDAEGILEITGVFDQFNEPSRPIPPEISLITGITDEMVKGRRFDVAAILNFIGDADLVIAHNAGFDRKFCEYHFPDLGFSSMSWHCSFQQINWASRGKKGGSLEVLAAAAGISYGSHRADADCLATAWVLNTKGPQGRTAFAEMLENGQDGVVHIIARAAPIPVKDLLKKRGYRWAYDENDRTEACGYARVWHREVPNQPEALASEAEFLRHEIYGRDTSLPAFHKGPQLRYSSRDPGDVQFFNTMAPVDPPQSDQPETHRDERATSGAGLSL